MQSLIGKVAIVTGSSAGIGKGIALKLASHGARVVVTGRNIETGQLVVDQICSQGGEAIFFAADVLSLGDMHALAERAASRFGRIDILVASAHGIPPTASTGPSSYFQNLEPVDVTETVSKVILAKLNPTKAVLSYMVPANNGTILFITSEGGRFPTPGQTAVSIYAGGLVMMTKVLAKEVSRYKIRVNAIAVTLVQDTPSWERFQAKTDIDVSRFNKIIGKAPFGLAKPEDIADVAAFLVSDQAAFITGTTVSPTGGVTFS